MCLDVNGGKNRSKYEKVFFTLFDTSGVVT